jgi:hypothetical protein
MRNGKGCFTWPDGDKYEGFWYMDGRMGSGKFYQANGNIMDQVWNEVKPNYSTCIPKKFPE